MDNIGDRLRAERERLGMSQDSFAEVAGVGKRALIHYEKTERSPDANFLSAIANAGADVLYILTGQRLSAVEQYGKMLSEDPRAAAYWSGDGAAYDAGEALAKRAGVDLVRLQSEGSTTQTLELDATERLLVEAYRHASTAGKDAILLASRAIAASTKESRDRA